MIHIDGSQGEGGGQILRSALTLSLLTGRPFRIERIRANRAKPGLMRQHLTAVQAAQTISGGQAVGATAGSQTLEFQPGTVRGGQYDFAIGTAGSCTLVLQTVLLPLLLAGQPSSVHLCGGTHNPAAPPADFLQRAFLPLLQRMGARVELRLERHGFYPAGGGELKVLIQPCARLAPLQLTERGALLDYYAEALLAGLPLHIAERELETVRKRLGWSAARLHLRALSSAFGPGNALVLTLIHEHVTEVFTGFGEKGVRAENVARMVCNTARAYLDSAAAVGPHLADQLLLPLALAGGGCFTTVEPTRHSLSNIQVIELFMPVQFRVEREDGGRYRIEVAAD